MRARWIRVCGHALVLTLALTAAAGGQVVKLATLVPDGSVWDKALKGMGSEWRTNTAGRVQLRIYPGGVAGDEPDVLRKMRIGQLHAGALTVAGLTGIDESFRVLSIPLFFDSYEELYFVLHRLEPVLRQRLRDKGFELLHWGHAGWVHFFSARPVREVDDLRRQKIFVWSGEDEMVQWWKREGFQPVALAATDIMTGLQTGMIEALPTTPLAALSLQWFRQTPYMHDLGLAPLVGATVFTSRAWNGISEADREALRAAALRVERRLEDEIPAQDDRAVEEMAKRGLQVTTSADPATWRQAAETFAASMRGSMVPEDIFDLAVEVRDEFRRGAVGGGER